MSNDIWSIVLLIGLTGWITSSIFFMFRAFPEKGVFNSVSGIRWGGATVISLIIWIIGLLNA